MNTHARVVRARPNRNTAHKTQERIPRAHTRAQCGLVTILWAQSRRKQALRKLELLTSAAACDALTCATLRVPTNWATRTQSRPNVSIAWSNRASSASVQRPIAGPPAARRRLSAEPASPAPAPKRSSAGAPSRPRFTPPPQPLKKPSQARPPSQTESASSRGHSSACAAAVISNRDQGGASGR